MARDNVSEKKLFLRCQFWGGPHRVSCVLAVYLCGMLNLKKRPIKDTPYVEYISRRLYETQFRVVG